MPQETVTNPTEYEGLASGRNSDSQPGQKCSRMWLLLGCFWVCILIVVYLCYLYYDSVTDGREIINNTNTSISEPYLDKETDEHINCTQEHPCKFTCMYVKEHFKKTPEDCEYPDHWYLISWIIEILLILAAISCIFGKGSGG